MLMKWSVPVQFTDGPAERNSLTFPCADNLMFQGVGESGRNGSRTGTDRMIKLYR